MTSVANVSPAITYTYSQPGPDPAKARVDLTQPLSDLDQAWRLATALAQSSLVPQALQGSPANVLLVLMMGRDLGLNAGQAVRSIYVPSSGRPQLTGQLVLAKLREAGHDYEYTEDDMGCVFTVIRDSGRKYSASFSLDDALAAGLVSEKDGKLMARSPKGFPLPWELYRSDMYFWRAASRAIRRGAPEVMLGFAIQGAGDDAEPTGPVILEPPPAPPGGEGQREGAAPPAGLQDRPQAPGTSPGGGPAQDEIPEWERRLLEEQHQETMAEVAAELKAMNDGQLSPGPSKSGTEATQHTAGPAAPMANRQQQAQVADRFAALGWDIKQYKSDVLRACSFYCKRPITSAADLTPQEATGLAAELGRLARTVESDYQPAALADLVGKWEAEAGEEDV